MIISKVNSAYTIAIVILYYCYSTTIVHIYYLYSNYTNTYI